jgi:hypothetical protein
MISEGVHGCLGDGQLIGLIIASHANAADELRAAALVVKDAEAAGHCR